MFDIINENNVSFEEDTILNDAFDNFSFNSLNLKFITEFKNIIEYKKRNNFLFLIKKIII